MGSVIAAVFLYVFSKEQHTAEENFESLRFLAFSTVFMVSFVLMFNLMAMILILKSKPKHKKEPVKLRHTQIVHGVGYIALVVLIVLTDFSVITFWAIAFGLFTGVFYSLYLLVGKILTRIWNSAKQGARKRYFDEFTKRE